MHLYLKYQSLNTFDSKDIIQVKVFFKTRSKFKIKVTRSKVLAPKEIIHLYLMYQSYNTFGSNDIARLKFFKAKSKFKIKLTRSKVLVQNESTLHEVSTSELSESYPPWFKIYSAG
jgi:hypothetical protein